MHWFSLTSNQRWQIKLRDARFGYYSIWKSKASKAIIDTSVLYIYIPKSDYDALVVQWKTKSGDIINNDQYTYMNQRCVDIAYLFGPIKV
jgi:hypothetical protein